MLMLLFLQLAIFLYLHFNERLSFDRSSSAGKFGHDERAGRGERGRSEVN